MAHSPFQLEKNIVPFISAMEEKKIATKIEMFCPLYFCVIIRFIYAMKSEYHCTANNDVRDI